MRAIVTGATGMIGIALINNLLEQGYECIAIVRENSTKTNLLPKHKNLEILECDINKLVKLNLPKPANVFFHLAWVATVGKDRDNVYLQENNVKNAIDAVSLAHKCGCEVFVGVGSQAEYGSVSEKLSATTPTNPTSGYGIAKYAASKLTQLLATQLGMKHCWARILSIYGENDSPNTLMSYLIKSFMSNEDVNLTKCEQQWDYLYVKDCANALRLIAEKGKDGKIYTIGSGEAQLLSNYVKIVYDNINTNSIINYGAKDYYKNQPMYLCADITELKNDTGFTPKYTFNEGIKNTIKDYIERQK